MRTVILLAYAAAAAACTASASEVAPPRDQLFFPTGMAVAPGDTLLFVANANSELRYDSGSVSVVDLGVVDNVIAGWTSATPVIPDGCTPDTDHTEMLICDESGIGNQPQFLLQDSGARVGNFATDIAVQDLGGGALRLIVPTRGDPSITWVDWDGTRLSCNNSSAGFALCDETHRLSYLHNDPNLALLPDEPFMAFADSVANFAIVTHLTSGVVTLIDSPPDGDAIIADMQISLFQPDPVTGLRGATGVSGRTPGASDIVYVGSRSEDRIQMLTVGRPVNGMLPYLVTGNWFFEDFVGGNSGLSIDTRGMLFSQGGNRLYVVNRDPATLQIYDTSLGPTGSPKNKGVAASDICRDASMVTALDAGAGERAYITCFDDGQLYVVDPQGLSQLERVIEVGRGPYAVAAAPTRQRVYVTNFLEDTISVIDASPTSPLHNRVVLKIGIPRPPQ